jgi:hypothetical protein
MGYNQQLNTPFSDNEFCNKMNRYPRITIIADDWFVLRSRHTNGYPPGYCHKPASVNMVFSDGSVSSVADKNTLFLLINYYLASQTTGVCSGWKLLDTK